MGWQDWLFPARCAGCGVRAGVGLCASCLANARPAPREPPPPGVDAWYAALVYEGAAREAIARLKYRNARAPLALLAGLLDAALPPAPSLAVDAVTWVPTTAGRRRERGFDQAELLARALGRRRRLPVRALLRRVGGEAQTGLDAAARARGPAFAAAPSPVPRAVLLVDDVVTTGATMRNAATALRFPGCFPGSLPGGFERCERVIGASVARTLLKGDRRHSEPPLESNRGATGCIPPPRAAIQCPGPPP